MCAEICTYIDWLSPSKCINELIARELIGRRFIFNRNIFPQRESDGFHYAISLRDGESRIIHNLFKQDQSNLAVQ